MPLSVAMRYRFWPRFTVVVTPGLGVDTATGPRSLPPPLRLTTRLLAQPATRTAASNHKQVRAMTVIRLAPSTPGSHRWLQEMRPRPSRSVQSSDETRSEEH